MRRAAEIFGITAPAAVDLYESTAHEAAFQLAATALQAGPNDALDVLAAVVHESVQDLDRPADHQDVLMAAIIERLLIFIRSIGATSPHPLAENLRTHADLTAVKADQMLAALEEWRTRTAGAEA
ncbi:hypothetical protein [Microbacterium sp. SA39]|uniref:hypothetical protein n=1 Tax=Microbacterium sp. SA39 TaxID=1263625 RepID=UPI0005F9C2C0|nr:hypothetical protein [Microbacterium sp. SA39]KJQ54151.1 hypothetical protein RS85_02222 [Microbacterium sp. SA39]